MGEWRYNSTILNLGIRGDDLVSFLSLPLYLWDPFYRRLGGPQSQSEFCVEEKISCPHRKSNPNTSVIEPIA
jgi:hypothetical protein